MIIEDYLSATRSNCSVLDVSKSKHSKVMNTVISALSEKGLKFSLVQSSDCKTEILELNGDKWVIFDIQIEKYMGALDLVHVLSDDKNDLENHFFGAATFIACNELFFLNRATLAKNIYNHYSSGIFSNPPTTPRTFAKIFYILFHEVSHDKADKDPDDVEYIYIDVDEVYNEIVSDRLKSTYINIDLSSNFYYQTTFPDLYKNLNRLESAVDCLAALHVQGITHDDEKFSISVGGYVSFLHSSLVCIHQLILIDKIKNTVKMALNGDSYEETSQDLLYQRLRITRYLFSRLIVDGFGIDVAEKSWNKFTKYLESVPNEMVNDVFKQLHRVILSNKETFSEKNNESNVEYCLREFFKV